MKERAKSDGSDTSPLMGDTQTIAEETDIERTRFHARNLVTGICELALTLVVNALKQRRRQRQWVLNKAWQRYSIRITSAPRRGRVSRPLYRARIKISAMTNGSHDTFTAV